MIYNILEIVVTPLLLVSFPSLSLTFELPRNHGRDRVVPASLQSMPEAINLNNDDQQKSGNNNLIKKPRNNNPAVVGTNFLRKKTADLLQITSNSYDNESGVNNLLGRKMKVVRKTFNWLIDSWVFSGELDAADKAYALLTRMEELDSSASTFVGIRPDVRIYTKVMNAISRSGRSDAGELAKKILEKMNHLYSSGHNVNVKPNTLTFTALVEAYANSGAPGSALIAAKICDVMIQKWASGDPDVRPTSRSFNAAINAFAKSGENDAAQQAERLFEKMLECYKAGNKDCKPNSVNYNSVINAIANSDYEGSVQRARELLQEMDIKYRAGDEDVKPTTISFNTVIDAYAKSGLLNAGERAEDILHYMEELYERGENIDAKPNARSFNSAINAYAKSGCEDAALKAEAVLDRMKKLYEAGNCDVRPDTHSFSTVINAWARSRKNEKAEKALNLFRKMKKLYEAGNKSVRPNVVAYNAVLNACAFTNGDVRESNRAVEIAHFVLRDLEQSSFGVPDQITYGTFLKVCTHQMADCDARDKVVEVVFKKCCKDGQVGNMVVQELKLVTKSNHYARLTGRAQLEEINTKELPKDWWCNVVEGKWQRQKQRLNEAAGK
mmetsp:Transcript_27375/g.31243  ORF Transcript_27375/g.31243 Transcript_27375/m.31243 type:complete len:611 (-) Transcript_27375:1030-2862(-)